MTFCLFSGAFYFYLTSPIAADFIGCTAIAIARCVTIIANILASLEYGVTCLPFGTANPVTWGRACLAYAMFITIVRGMADLRTIDCMPVIRVFADAIFAIIRR